MDGGVVYVVGGRWQLDGEVRVLSGGVVVGKNY